MGDRWGDEWEDGAKAPSTLWVRFGLVFLIGVFGLVAILGAVYEVHNWNTSRVPSGIVQDYSPGVYLIAAIVCGVVGALALGSSWLIWVRRNRTPISRRRLIRPEQQGIRSRHG
jgi:hypothetical protein